MIGFGETLDTIDFDDLVSIARSRLPGLAPEWTDYNIHDPGIMLVDLLAWTADVQTYALSRNRRDERLAMAALLAARARGAVPATGFVAPSDPVDEVTQVTKGTRLVATGGLAPRVETAHAVSLLPVEIESLRSIGPGFVVDQTQVHRRGSEGFAAFGPGAPAGAELHIVLRALHGHALPSDRALTLALGWRIADADGPDDLPSALAPIKALDMNGHTLAIVEGAAEPGDVLRRGGVMLFELPADAARDPTRITIVLRQDAPALLAPMVLQVVPNALPVAQQASFTLRPPPANGRPGQVIAIEPLSLFESDEPAAERTWLLADDASDSSKAHRAIAITVTEDGVRDMAWPLGELDTADPADRRCKLLERPDGTEIALRFGNGINGRVPGEGDALTVRLVLSCGAGGNVALPVDWVLNGFRSRWRNVGPISGGVDAEDADGALGRAVDALGAARLLATSRQLAEAAAALPPSLGIERIDVIDGWQRGRRRPAVAATRTLLVTRRAPGRATPAWLRAVRRALAPRIALGERLLVEAPVLRPFGLAVSVEIETGGDPAQVKAAIGRAIGDRLAGNASHGQWPLGRDVDGTAIAGWVRRIAGVRRVVNVALVAENGSAMPGDALAVGRGELPDLRGQVEVTIVGARS